MRLRNQLILAAAGLLVAASFVMAQGPRTMMASHEQRFKMLVNYLDLTPQQQTQAQVIHTNAKAQAEPIAAQLKLGHEAMAAAVKANKSNAEIEGLGAQQGVLLGRLAGIVAKGMRDFYQILTPAQQKKLDDAREHFKTLIEHRVLQP